MARHYGLPVMGSGSGTDAFVPGAQAGYEKAFSSLLGHARLARPDGGAGLSGGRDGPQPRAVLIDVEIFRMCRKAHEGITVADDLWLDDVLERRGPGGHFVSEKSTRANTRSGEWYLPGLGVHDSYDAWTAAGRPSLLDEARRESTSCSPRTSRCRWPTTSSGSSRSCAREQRRRRCTA